MTQLPTSVHSQRTVSAFATNELVNALLIEDILTEAELVERFPRLHQLRQQITQNNMSGNPEEMYLEEALLIQLWQTLAQGPNASGAGLKVARHINDKTKGFLATWVGQSADLGEAYDIFRANIAFLNPSESWQEVKNEHSSIIHFHFTEPGYPNIAIESRMAAFIAWGAYFCQREIPVLSVRFTYDPPTCLDLYHEAFGPNLHFNAECCAIEIAAHAKAFPIPSASRYLKKMMEQKAILLRRQFPDSLRHSVYSLIADNLLYFQKIDDACNALNMSRSTLYRQLKDEGASYRDIVDQVRRDKAREFKAQGMKDSYIAEKIGFHDAAAYYKARKRWDTH